MELDDALLFAALAMRLVVRPVLEPVDLDLAFGLYLVGMLLVLPLLAWRTRRRWSTIGLARGDLPGSLRAVVLLLPLAVAEAALVAWVVQGRLGLAPAGLVTLAVLNGLLTAALPEELLFRGFFLARLRQGGLKPWPAVVVQAAAFAAGHLRYLAHGPLLLLVAAAGWGLIWGWMTTRYRTLAGPIALHTLSNALVFTLLGGSVQRL